mgnify:CR=1 FL=1
MYHNHLILSNVFSYTIVLYERRFILFLIEEFIIDKMITKCFENISNQILLYTYVLYALVCYQNCKYFDTKMYLLTQLYQQNLY